MKKECVSDEGPGKAGGHWSRRETVVPDLLLAVEVEGSLQSLLNSLRLSGETKDGDTSACLSTGGA